MEFYYQENDWYDLAPDRKGFFRIRDVDVPYVVLENEPEVTDDPAKLGPALEKTFGDLWELRNK